MKKILYTISFSLLIGLSLSAQEKSSPSFKLLDQEENTDGPIMYFETNTVDYGTIEQGSEPTRKVVFSNNGNAPLVIKNAKGSCGCTVPIWSKEPIMPGQTDTLTIRYDTKRLGKISKTVSLYTNQTDDAYVLRVVGEVKPKPKEPEALPEKSPNILSGNGNGNK